MGEEEVHPAEIGDELELEIQGHEHSLAGGIEGTYLEAAPVPSFGQRRGKQYSRKATTSSLSIPYSLAGFSHRLQERSGVSWLSRRGG